MSQKSDRLVRLIPEIELPARMSMALELIDEITHDWTKSGFADKCASCGLEPTAVWHRRARDLVAAPKVIDEQEALL